MNISGFNAIGMDATTISKLFAPISADETAASNASLVTPSVSSATSGANVTSAAIAAIQALVQGGTASSSANAAAAETQSLPAEDTATGTTTFTPLNSTKPVTMPTDEYQWCQSGGVNGGGIPTTLDEVKAQFYQTNTVSNLNSMITQAEARGDQASVSYFTSLQNAVKTGSVKFQLLDHSVNYQYTGSVIRSGEGNITGMTAGATMDQEAFDKVYNDNSQWYQVGGNPFISGYVISWSKT